MPYSMVMEFYTGEDIRNKKLPPRVLHSFILGVIRTVDPEISKHLHDETANKSITLRELSHNNNFLTLRLTLLDEKLFDRFANILINACMNTFDLNGTEMKISKIMCSSDSNNFWANYRTYGEIYENASKTDNSIQFSILTPLAFKRGDGFTALPLPELFFKSIHKKWNGNAEITLDDSLLEGLENKISLNSFDIKTDVITDGKINFTGSVGKFSYKIAKNQPENFIHYINVLSDYAYFSGVGAKTAMGMGQVYRFVF